MNSQEIINAIDAEIAEVDSVLSELMAEGFSPTTETAYYKGYIMGLAFAKALVESHRAATTNPYEPPSRSEPSLEDRVERLEERIDGSRPASFIESVFAFLIVMGAGAILFYVATRLGK